jgi:hypothetical protein
MGICGGELTKKNYFTSQSQAKGTKDSTIMKIDIGNRIVHSSYMCLFPRSSIRFGQGYKKKPKCNGERLITHNYTYM